MKMYALRKYSDVKNKYTPWKLLSSSKYLNKQTSDPGVSINNGDTLKEITDGLRERPGQKNRLFFGSMQIV